MKTILYATDYSEPSRYALHFAPMLARDCQARLLIAPVSDLECYTAGELVEAQPRPSAEEIQRLATVVPDDGRVPFEHRLLCYPRSSDDLHPADEITKLAEEEDVDAIVVATAPDHFLQAHLWEHVAKKHAPRIFAWTFAALLLSDIASSHVGARQWIEDNPLMLLLVACMLGIIPESGPHLAFVTLYVEDSIPFSVLLASSIVQDGHGVLPLLGDSLSAFAAVKAVNLMVGLLIGLAVFAWGW